MKLFNGVPLAPDDAILGVVESFKQDPREGKVNLSIGIYSDNAGRVPILKAVKAAEAYLFEHPTPRVYLPMSGLGSYVDCVQKLLFTEEHALYQQKRLSTIQTLGGTGALKIGGDFLHTVVPNSTVYVSNPTWSNHIAIFEGAGFEVKDYPYFDEVTKGVAFDEFYQTMETLPEQSIVVLHACCHNPTGADLSPAQWTQVAKLFKERNLIPFLDMAYQGFSKGIREDAAAIHIFAEQDVPVFIATSFSKSFSLYSERIGALTVITSNEEEQARITSQLKTMVRAIYSSPPSYGAQLVHYVLADDKLRAEWEAELAEMRDRIKDMRSKFVKLLNTKQDKIDFSFINDQAGMFSYSGLSPDQVEKMKKDYAIYTVDTGRICIAALNDDNIELAANAVVNVL
ncbi:MAG TPA: aspartate/tyrosine/aromatic aminotransferase [Candidatus Ignatzschineria merdigallinarum]|uniref:Aspartate/tyrosine/aromatic aminotransferase n=1 Tax=Candidatus Ignatzschineria merdigallinarum TaxID=2838621 RepID=A0A9D1Q450_9GAMM|nr:aspartate/tyrosine/aromatic aminotransferase [Candidatus Ignatzschineria merdigallinarum]